MQDDSSDIPRRYWILIASKLTLFVSVREREGGRDREGEEGRCEGRPLDRTVPSSIQVGLSLNKDCSFS